MWKKSNVHQSHRLGQRKVFKANRKVGSRGLLLSSQLPVQFDFFYLGLQKRLFDLLPISQQIDHAVSLDIGGVKKLSY